MCTSLRFIKNSCLCRKVTNIILQIQGHYVKKNLPCGASDFVEQLLPFFRF